MRRVRSVEALDRLSVGSVVVAFAPGLGVGVLAWQKFAPRLWRAAVGSDETFEWSSDAFVLHSVGPVCVVFRGKEVA